MRPPCSAFWGCSTRGSTDDRVRLTDSRVSLPPSHRHAEERYSLDDADIPEAMRNHPHARRFFKKIGERIELIPMQLKVIEQYQEILALDQPEETTTMVPKSKLSGAINYMLNRWESFARFLESGCIPLSNNVAERALKYPILGRKAWLFVGNPTAGETAAKLITLTKTCNRLHIDPFAYLQDVYARLPTMGAEELPSLLPDRWLQEHPQHLLPHRVQEAIERAQRAHEQRAARRVARGGVECPILVYRVNEPWRERTSRCNCCLKSARPF